MAYGDPGQTLSSAIQAGRQNREQQFFGNLLQYGMTAGGDFNIVNDKPVYTEGEALPDKTTLWNQYVSMKNNRISAADVQNFEAQYTQASAMRTQRQMAELNKMSMQGMSDKKIKDSIEGSPQLYNSLLDLVSTLESSGDEQAFAQAQMVRGYLPSTDKSVIGGLIEDPGMLGRVGLPLAIAGGSAGVNYLQQTPQEQIDAAKKARADKASINKEIKEQKAKLVDTGRKPSLIRADIATANKNLNLEEKKHLLKRNDLKIKDLRQRVVDLKAEQKNANKKFAGNKAIQKKIDALEENRKGIKTVKPESRFASLRKKIPKGGGALSPGSLLSYAALGQAGDIGEYLGGDTGRQIGRNVGNLGFLGMAGRTLAAAPVPGPLGVVSKIAGAGMMSIPAIIDIYNQVKGK